MILFVFFSSNVMSQDPGPPPPPPEHGTSGNVPGGGAPVGNGIHFLLFAATAYGSYKYYKHKKGIKSAKNQLI